MSDKICMVACENNIGGRCQITICNKGTIQTDNTINLIDASNYISKNIIREKIKELEKELKETTNDKIKKYTPTTYFVLINILQELLEKED